MSQDKISLYSGALAVVDLAACLALYNQIQQLRTDMMILRKEMEGRTEAALSGFHNLNKKVDAIDSSISLKLDSQNKLNKQLKKQLNAQIDRSLSEAASKNQTMGLIQIKEVSSDESEEETNLEDVTEGLMRKYGKS